MLQYCSDQPTDRGIYGVYKDSELSDSLFTDVIFIGTSLPAIRLDEARLDSFTIFLSGSDVTSNVYEPNEAWLRAWTKSKAIQTQYTEPEFEHSIVAWSDTLQIGFDLQSATGIQILTILAYTSKI